MRNGTARLRQLHMNVCDKQGLELLKIVWFAYDKNNVNCSFNWNHFNVDMEKFFMANFDAPLHEIREDQS